MNNIDEKASNGVDRGQLKLEYAKKYLTMLDNLALLVYFKRDIVNLMSKGPLYKRVF